MKKTEFQIMIPEKASYPADFTRVTLSPSIVLSVQDHDLHMEGVYSV